MKVFTGKRLDFIITLLILFIGFTLAWFLQGTFWGKPLFAWAVFGVIPITVFLSLRERKQFNLIAAGTIVFGVVFALILETLAEFNGAWHVVDPLIPYRFPGGASLDAIGGYLFMTLLTLVIYEHFIDSPNRRKVKLSLKRVNTALIPTLAVAVFLLISSKFAPHLISTDYLYFKAGVVVVLSIIVIGFLNPRIYTKMAKIMPLFFILYLVSEYFAVKFNWWTYPSGQYVGHISILDISFPFEELLFWMLFYAASLVAYYETWIDDGR